MTPDANIVHQLPKRIRIRIPSQKGKPAYFSEVQDAFSFDENIETLEVNPLTGTMVFTGEDIDIRAIAEYAEKNSLFRLGNAVESSASLPDKIIQPVGEASNFLRKMTAGKIDLPGAAFLTLVGVGLYQFIRGNKEVPSWYNAFWYAFGLAQFLYDRKSDKNSATITQTDES